MALVKQEETKAAQGTQEDLEATKPSSTEGKETPNEEQVKPIEDPEDQIITMKASDFKNAIKEQVQEMMAIESVKAGNSDPNAFDKNDFVEIPFFFFCFKDKHSVYCDKKPFGNTPPPRGPIKFKAEYRSKEKMTKGERAIALSKYTTNSKSEAEWLRQHEDFGRLFYEELEQAIGKNAIIADRMASITTRINQLSDNDIVSRCTHEGIAVGNNKIASLRKQLIEHLVNQETTEKQQGFLDGISTRDNPKEGKINVQELSESHKGNY